MSANFGREHNTSGSLEDDAGGARDAQKPQAEEAAVARFDFEPPATAAMAEVSLAPINSAGSL